MKAGFTESTFGFALTNEIINDAGNVIIKPPEFPSLIEEGNSGGYDTKIDYEGYALFLQFKLSEYMVSNTAKEWNYTFAQPYYRFNIMRRSKSEQHQLLVDLQENYNNVYYAAPGFIKESELIDLFQKNQIFQKSVFVTPFSIGELMDDQQHRVIFQSGVSVGYFCSKPAEVKVLNNQEFIFKINQNQNEKHLKSNKDFDEVSNDILDIARKRGIMTEEKVQNINNPYFKVALLSKVLLGADFYLIKP